MKSIVTILMTAMIVLFFSMGMLLNTEQEIKTNEENRQYGVILANACLDGMKEVTADCENVFNTKLKREKALTGFYESILRGFGTYDESEDTFVCEKTPFVLLIDNEGFYLSYNACFDEYISEFKDEWGNTYSPSQLAKISAVSSLNTWSEEINGNVVRFYLNDHVQVIKKDNTIIEGKREEVYKECPIECLKTDNTLNDEKRRVIIQRLEDEINFMLNTQPIGENKYYEAYSITLAQVPFEDFNRMISSPGIISFLQGDVKVRNGNTLDVYAYAGSEVIRPMLFYIKDGHYYKYKEGNKGDAFGDMRTCAKEGANPSSEATWDN